MPVPTIDPTTSVLSYPQWQPWEHTFSASNSPTSWNITSGSFPTGMIFQPTLAVTASAGTSIFATGHGLTEGALVVFTHLSGGSGLATGTLYYVRDGSADTFSLTASAGGPAISIGSDITSANLTRIGFLKGTGSVPGVGTVRLTATNSSGASAEVLFTISIEPATAAPDGISLVAWDLSSGAVVRQTSSVINLTAPSDNAPVYRVKEGDDLLTRIVLVQDDTIIGLDTSVDGSEFELFLKELEPESQVAISDDFAQRGTGAGASYLLHCPLTRTALISALSNYEADTGTFFNALGEFRLKYVNPDTVGPAVLTISSGTFAVRVERPIGNGAA